MSTSKLIAFAVGVSSVSRIVRIFGQFFLIPIMFRYLTKEELGIWFLFANSQNILSLFNFGIAPVLQREIAFCKGKSGTDMTIPLTDEVNQEIADLIVTAKWLLQKISFIVFFVAVLSSFFWIKFLDLQTVSTHQALFVWIIFCLGYSVNTWFSYFSSWLNGIGEVGWEGIIQTLIFTFVLIVQIIVVFLGGRLIAIAMINLIGSLLNRFFFVTFIKWKKPELFKFKGKFNPNYLKKIVKTSLSWWLIDVGNFFTDKTDDYFIVSFQGVAELPLYRAISSLIANPFQIAILMTQSSGVFISHAWQAGDLKKVQEILFYNLQVALSIMASAVAFIFLVNQEFLKIWINQDIINYQGIVIVFCVMATLRAQDVVLGFLYRQTQNDQEWIFKLICGVMNLIFTWFLVQRFGLLGVAMGTLFANFCTTVWYNIYRVFHGFHFSIKDYFQRVFSLWFLILSISLLSGKVTKYFLSSLFLTHSNLIIVVTIFIQCILILVLLMWFKILSADHKKIIIKKIRTYIKIKGKKS